MEKNVPNAQTSLHIAFHLKNTLNAATEAAKIGKLLSEIFGPEQVETVDLDTQDKEVVYRVNKPVIASTDEYQEFFKSLKDLLAQTEEFHPHFTQIYG